MTMQRVSDKAVVFLPWEAIEPEAQQQILNTASMPFVFKHVAVMPDCHYGKGATVGTVLATKGARHPGRRRRRHRVRHDCRAHPAAALGHPGPRGGPRRHRAPHPDERGQEQPHAERRPRPRGSGRSERSPRTPGPRRTSTTGTGGWRSARLGGGNHFIELAEDADGTVWLTLHSGSRGVGNKIGNHYIKVAQELCKKMGVRLPDRDLAYLPEDHPAFAAYIRDLNWAQQFALHNRNEMMDRVLTRGQPRRPRRGRPPEPSSSFSGSTRTTTSRSRNTTSAATSGSRARAPSRRSKDNWAMIPGSMGTRSYIVVGKENPMSFHSAPHGAGRRYSRTKARGAVQHGGPAPRDGGHRVPALEGSCSTRSRAPTRISTRSWRTPRTSWRSSTSSSSSSTSKATNG